MGRCWVCRIEGDAPDDAEDHVPRALVRNDAVEGEEPVLVLAEPVVEPEEVGHAAAQDAREPEELVDGEGGFEIL